MIRVAFAGAQDSGKTTMATAMTARYGGMDKIAAYVPEYARQYLREFEVRSMAEQLYIASRQAELEQSVAPGAEVLFTDSPVFLAYVYGLHMADLTDRKDVYFLSRLYERVLLVRYDVVFYLEPIRPEPRHDGLRQKQTRLAQPELEMLVSSFLAAHQVAGRHEIVQEQDYDGRMASVADVLDRYLLGP